MPLKVCCCGDAEVDVAGLLATTDRRLFVSVNYTAMQGGTAVELTLCDTTGQEADSNGRQRSISYLGSDIVIIFFSLVRRETLESAR
eukprot:7159713-Prymnesium_polylepis.1